MIYAVIAAVVLIVAAIVAVDIQRSRRKKAAPRAEYWIGPVGHNLSGFDIGARDRIRNAVSDIEAFTGRKLDAVVLILRADPIKLPGGGTAAGIYHSTKKGWDHAWIELYSWSALHHELLHHATGLEDTPEFRELLARLEMRTGT